MIVDNAIYVDGRRKESRPLEKTREACREGGGFAWVVLYEPSREELDAVAGEFGLHEGVVGEALKTHQRPKVERYGETLFVALKAAHYEEEEEEVRFGEVHVLVGPNFVVTVRWGEAPDLGKVRREMEGDPGRLRRGPAAVLCAVVEPVVDGYGPVVEGLENDIDEIEEQVFGETPDASRRIYELSREVIQFHRATRPLAGALGRLSEDEAWGGDQEVRRCLRGAADRALRATEQAEGFRELLSNILNVNLTSVSVQQNEQVQKISAWAAILIVPTIIAGIYGMNFKYMPELHWHLGYPLSLALMVGISALLYLGFKRSGWL